MTRLMGYFGIVFGLSLLIFAMIGLWFIPPGGHWNIWTFGLLQLMGFGCLCFGLDASSSGPLRRETCSGACCRGRA